VFVHLQVVPRSEITAEEGNDADRLGTSTGIDKLRHAFSKGAQKAKKIKVSDIFFIESSVGERQEALRVLALACAGAGKTMLFTKKSPRDWANGLIWQNVVLLVAVEMRWETVRKARNVIELFDLESHGLILDGEKKEVIDFATAHPEQVCLVLDGLDETKLSECSDFVHKVIRGERLCGVRLVNCWGSLQTE